MVANHPDPGWQLNITVQILMSENIIEYYTDTFRENDRHQDGFGQIQRMRTLHVIKQHIQKDNSTIMDIGGATGAYSFDLAKAGHSVFLFDIVPAHIEKAREISAITGVDLSGYHIGDARSMQFNDNSFDAVIIHGPLYHITDIQERHRVLCEAYRILKPDGVVFAFAINRYAGVFYGVHSGLILDDEYFDMIRTEVETGFRSRNPTWHFHLPEELEKEVTSAGFQRPSTKGIVSPVWMLADVETKLSDTTTRDKILRVSELLENEPKIGQDFVCIGYKA